MTNDVEALSQLVTDGVVHAVKLDADAHRHGRDPAAARPEARPRHVPHLPVLAVSSVAFRIASAGAYRATREKIATITAYLQETLSGIRIVRAFGQEERHKKQFRGPQRREPRSQHAHGHPQRGVLPGRRDAVRRRDRS